MSGGFKSASSPFHNASSEPRVTVAMPVFNHERYVQEAIQSVIDQSYKNIELMIIDDGSFDASAKVVESMRVVCERRFARFSFISRPNRGVSATLNEILNWSEADYFAPIASDDRWMHEKTSLQVRYLEGNPSCPAVFANVQIINASGAVIQEPRLPPASYVFPDILTQKYYLPSISNLHRSEILRNIGGFCEVSAIEDWDLYLRITEGGSALFRLGNVLAAYRRHGHNTSRNLELMHAERMKILFRYKDHERYSEAKSRVHATAADDFANNGDRRKAIHHLLQMAAHRDIRTIARVSAKCLLPSAMVARLRAHPDL
jgi:alpha-1,3-rhamnosyltransferase